METILLILVVSSMNIMSAFVTGYLLFRCKKEAHDTLFPVRRTASKGPVNIDEFAVREDEEESALPDAIAVQNQVFGKTFSVDRLKDKS